MQIDWAAAFRQYQMVYGPRKAYLVLFINLRATLQREGHL